MISCNIQPQFKDNLLLCRLTHHKWIIICIYSNRDGESAEIMELLM